MRRLFLVLFVLALLGCACSSSGGGPSIDPAARTRVLDGLAAMDKATSYEHTYSVSTQDQSSGDSNTLICFVIIQQPGSAAGDRMHVTNWGKGTVLDPQGACRGSASHQPTEAYLYDGVAYLSTGTPPTGTTDCLSSFRRLRISPQASAALRAGDVNSTRPDMPALVAAARSIQADGDTVRIDVDPDRVGSRDSSTGSPAPLHIDQERMTVTFTGSSITRTSVELVRGKQAVVSNQVFKSPSQEQIAPPPAACLTPGIGTLTDTMQLAAALGLR